VAQQVQELETEHRKQTETAPAMIDEAAAHSRQGLQDTSKPSRGRPLGGLTNVQALVAVALVLWLGIVVYLGARGAFVVASGTAPYPIALGCGLPLIVFLATFWLSAPFRKFLSNADLPLLTALQAWRFAGFGFIALYAYNVLPGAFAWPAGLGDMAIGLTAPWLALTLIRRPALASSRLFTIWNLLGILDLVVAIGAGTLSQLRATGTAGEIATTPMAQMPLLLIPAFLVPLFVMLHLTGLFQARRLTQALRN
jgi:hypothetical protein